MADRDPLSGKIFIGTCTDQKADRIKKLLETKDAELIKMPLIETGKAGLSREIKYMQDHLALFDWVFFTSGYGIRFFFGLMHQTDAPSNWHKRLKYAVIGKAAEEILHEYGIKADYVNAGAGGEDMAELFLNVVNETGNKILFPTGNLSEKGAVNILMRKHEVFPVEVYRTRMTDHPDREAMDIISSGKYDMILFLSPSAFNNFLRVCHPVLKQQTYRMGCIGHTTGKAIRAAGFTPDLIAGGKGIDDLLYHLEKYYYIVLT